MLVGMDPTTFPSFSLIIFPAAHHDGVCVVGAFYKIARRFDLDLKARNRWAELRQEMKSAAGEISKN